MEGTQVVTWLRDIQVSPEDSELHASVSSSPLSASPLCLLRSRALQSQPVTHYSQRLRQKFTVLLSTSLQHTTILRPLCRWIGVSRHPRL